VADRLSKPIDALSGPDPTPDPDMVDRADTHPASETVPLLLLFLAGLAMAAYGQLWWSRGWWTIGCQYYAVGAVLTVLAVLAAPPPVILSRPGSGSRPWRRLALISALVTLVAAASPMLYSRMLDAPPGLAYDEAKSLQTSLEFYTGERPASEWWRPDTDSNPAIYNFTTAALFRVVGPTPSAFRILNTTWALLAAITLLLYLRKTAGTLIALVASIWFIHTMWVVHLSRWCYSNSWAMLGCAMALAGTGLALGATVTPAARSHGRLRRLWPFALAGFGMVFAQYGYVSGRFVVPAVLASLLLGYLSQPDFLARNGPGLVVLVLVVIVVGAPWLGVIFGIPGHSPPMPETIYIRARMVGIQSNIYEEQSFSPIWHNTMRHLKLFTFEGDSTPLNNIPDRPLLHPIVSPLVLLGLVVGLVRWRWLVPALPLLWLSILIWAGILSNSKEMPVAHRLLPMAPVFFAAAAVYLAQGKALLDAALAGRSRRVWVVAYAVAAAALAGLTVVHGTRQHHLYFDEHATSEAVRLTFSPAEGEIQRRIEAAGAGTPTLIDDRLRSPELECTFYFEPTLSYTKATVRDLDRSLPEQGPVHIFLHPESQGLLDGLAAAGLGEVAVGRDTADGDAWFAELLIDDAAAVRAALGEAVGTGY